MQSPAPRPRLTEAGETLHPVLEQITACGHTHLGGGRYDPKRGKSISART